MSKKYFTKYFPVEGEIKMGDRYTPFKSGAVRHPLKRIGRSPEEDESYSRGRKVKLFLCSRDIQVGDKAFDSWGKEFDITQRHQEEDMDGNAITMVGDDNESTDLDNIYRIIGEVSPEAIWVIEGMEFDEKDIERYIIVKDGLPDFYGEAFKIRCPSSPNHFH